METSIATDPTADGAHIVNKKVCRGILGGHIDTAQTRFLFDGDVQGAVLQVELIFCQWSICHPRSDVIVD